MILNLSEMLKQSKEGKYAVGAFNTFNLETSQAIISAAEAKNLPVIIQVSEKTIEYAGMEEIFGIVQMLAKSSTVPVDIHLDHGTTVEMAKRCIEIGFSSVMFDGSRLPYEENVSLTASVVEMAHAKGVSVEGELGGVGKQTESAQTIESMMTDPDQAADFVNRTGVDALAIGVGTAHGMPLPEERIHFEVIENIASKVNVPLVLHGASNIADEDIKKAISLGITKINIDTEIRHAFTDALKEYMQNDPEEYDPRKILDFARQKAQEKVEEKIQVFGPEKNS